VYTGNRIVGSNPTPSAMWRLQNILRPDVGPAERPVFGPCQRRSCWLRPRGIGSICSLMALFLQTSGLRPFSTDFLIHCFHTGFSSDLLRTFRRNLGERGIWSANSTSEFPSLFRAPSTVRRAGRGILIERSRLDRWLGSHPRQQTFGCWPREVGPAVPQQRSDARSFGRRL